MHGGEQKRDRRTNIKIDKMLDKNLIEESYSPFAALVTLTFKKEEKKNLDYV